MSKSKVWVVWFLIIFLVSLGVLGGFTAFIDPYFHYHKPLGFVKYELKNQRYQNNGIVKHFDYDAIITGSSMTECFKTTEMDRLFGVRSVKVPYSGGSYKEVNDNLAVAVANNSEIKIIVRCLDYNRLFDGKDDVDYTEYPDYLYDDFILNDSAYLFNKNVLITAMQNLHGYLATGSVTLSFDDYCNWSDYYTYGKAAVDARYARDTIERVDEMLPVTREEYDRIDQNIEQNIVSLIRDNPDIEFYYYFAPYSIYYMDYWYQLGQLERQLKAERYIIEKLLPYENLHLFSFYTEYDVICNLDYYKDVAHHSGEINSRILMWMKEGIHELTRDNYEQYCEEEWNYYMNYDYDALFE